MRREEKRRGRDEDRIRRDAVRYVSYISLAEIQRELQADIPLLLYITYLTCPHTHKHTLTHTVKHTHTLTHTH